MSDTPYPERPRASSRLALVLCCALLLVGACQRTPPPPVTATPSELLTEATGYYCGMRLAEHEGPKGQIRLAGRAEPLWFSSVRDAIVFLRQPEEPRDIIAVWGTDMGPSAHGSPPDEAAWVDLRQAWFVIDSHAQAGMGGAEAVPFSRRQHAETFRERSGGRIVRLNDIPDAYVFGARADAGAAH